VGATHRGKLAGAAYGSGDQGHLTISVQEDQCEKKGPHGVYGPVGLTSGIQSTYRPFFRERRVETGPTQRSVACGGGPKVDANAVSEVQRGLGRESKRRAIASSKALTVGGTALPVVFSSRNKAAWPSRAESLCKRGRGLMGKALPARRAFHKIQVAARGPGRQAN